VIGLDTNVLIRWLAADPDTTGTSARQAATVEKRILESSETCFVNSVVVAETLWVTDHVFRQSREMQAEIVERLLDSQNVHVADRHAVESALGSFRKGGAGFSDHLIGALNAEAGCTTTLTFDKRAAKGPHFTTLS
jgi:predicted nucleic-acid-binding protein